MVSVGESVIILQGCVDPEYARVAQTLLTFVWWHNCHVVDRDLDSQVVGARFGLTAGLDPRKGPKKKQRQKVGFVIF